MADATISQKDLTALLEINLLDVLHAKDENPQDTEDFLIQFRNLTWKFFFDTDGAKLSKEEKCRVEKLLEEKKEEHALAYLKKKFPKIAVIMLKNELLAKKVAIMEVLDYKITLIKAKARFEKSKDSSSTLLKLFNFAREDKWQKFQELSLSKNTNVGSS